MSRVNNKHTLSDSAVIKQWESYNDIKKCHDVKYFELNEEKKKYLHKNQITSLPSKKIFYIEDKLDLFWSQDVETKRINQYETDIGKIKGGYVNSFSKKLKNNRINETKTFITFIFSLLLRNISINIHNALNRCNRPTWGERSTVIIERFRFILIENNTKVGFVLPSTYITSFDLIKNNPSKDLTDFGTIFLVPLTPNIALLFYDCLFYSCRKKIIEIHKENDIINFNNMTRKSMYDFMLKTGMEIEKFKINGYNEEKIAIIEKAFKNNCKIAYKDGKYEELFSNDDIKTPPFISVLPYRKIYPPGFLYPPLYLKNILPPQEQK